MVAWFAGIFYIWRLFVYHMESKSSEAKSQFEIMEKRLYSIIMWPGAILTILSGFSMFFLNLESFKTAGWLHTKIFIVLVFLFGLHLLAGYFRKKIAQGNTYKPKLFRIMNEIPTLLLIIIMTLLVFRSF